MIKIRNEEEADYERVEEITRKAFYNMYMPGCTEHYLVHIMRDHKDFIPELDFIIEMDGNIIKSVKIVGGCPGNTLAVSAMVEGRNIDEVINKLKGIPCGMRGTSCPDQLSKALEEIKNKMKN